MEDSEDKITNFESEVGPGVLQFSIQQSMALQEFQTKRTELKHSQKRTSCTIDILAAVLKAGPEHSGSRSDVY